MQVADVDSTFLWSLVAEPVSKVLAQAVRKNSGSGVNMFLGTMIADNSADPARLLNSSAPRAQVGRSLERLITTLAIMPGGLESD
jgi:hypothetical protein